MVSTSLGHVTNYCKFFFHFYKPYNNQTYEDSEPVLTNFKLQVMMTSASLGHAVKIYGLFLILLAL